MNCHIEWTNTLLLETIYIRSIRITSLYSRFYKCLVQRTRCITYKSNKSWYIHSFTCNWKHNKSFTNPSFCLQQGKNIVHTNLEIHVMVHYHLCRYPHPAHGIVLFWSMADNGHSPIPRPPLSAIDHSHEHDHVYRPLRLVTTTRPKHVLVAST